MRLPFFRRDVQREIDEELRFHFDARIEELVAQGMTPDDARAQALSEFGDVNQVRSRLREIDDRVARRRQRADLLDVLRQDFTHAARSLRRTPGVSITIILTLALGLGVNAAMFSLLDVLFLRPPALVAKPAELRRVWRYLNFRGGEGQFWSGFDYTSYAAVRQALEGSAVTALYRVPTKMSVGAGDHPGSAKISSATASYFRVLGIKPAFGRFYSEDEDRVEGGAPVVVISDGYWRREMGGDRAVLDRKIVLSGVPYTIIGVAPARFSGVDLDAADIWLPLSTLPGRAGDRNTPWYRNPAVNGFQIFFRLLPDARAPEVEQRVTAALRHVGEGGRQDTAAVVKLGSIILARGPGNISGEMRVAERLGGVAIIVLVIACANVVNLLLARAVRRRREIAVRLALGISRSRLLRLLITESVLLAGIAAVAALGAAAWGGTLLRTFLLPQVSWAETPLHWRVLSFALIAAIVAGVLAGLFPAVQSRATDLTNALKAGSRESGSHRSRLRSMLVICQAALSVTLLVGAALFVRSLSNIHGLGVGFSVNDLAFISVTPRGGEPTKIQAAAIADRLEQLEPRLATLPGVERVSFVSMRPKSGIQFAGPYYPEADTVVRRKPAPIFTAVSTNFFAASGIKLIHGHTFPESRGQLTVIVNQAMADSVWPNQDPIGRCIRFEKPDARCVTIIGISETAILSHVREQPSPQMYLPLNNMPLSVWPSREIVVRVNQTRLNATLGNVRALLSAEFPNAIIQTNTMAKAMEPEYRPWTLGATLFSLFGALAALVAAIGIYSSVSYAVNQRTHEFGVRAALGADSRSIVTQVLGEGTRTVAIGVAAGIVLAIATGRLIASLLYGVSAWNPFALALAGTAMIVIAGLACIAPAWRAARSDPVAALRAE